MEYVSIIRAITLPLVPTSGAGISFCGPDLIMPISLVYSGGSNARQRERSTRDAAFGAAVWQVQRGTFDGHPC